MTFDPFADYVDEPLEQLPALKFVTEGDTFKGKVLKVGAVFDNKATADNPNPGKSYPIEFEATYVNQEYVKKVGRQKEYIPPVVGDEVVWFVKVGHPSERELNRAAKNAGGNGVNVGDEVALKYIEAIDTGKPEPFKKMGFIVYPAVKSEDEDPFTAPF